MLKIYITTMKMGQLLNKIGDTNVSESVGFNKDGTKH